MKNIKVFVKHPEEAVGRACIINNDLKALQRIVGGRIEAITLADDLVVICNEEGRLMGLPKNIRLGGIEFVGTIIFAGVKEDDFADVPMSYAQYRRILIGRNIS